MPEALTLINQTTWAEIFAAWQEREKGLWDEHFYERGYPDWQTWRQKMFAPFHPEKREWNLFKIEQPSELVPKMWIGGFKGWRKYLPEGQTRIQFKDLVRSPLIRENGKVISVLENFPKATTIIGIRLQDEIILAEGMHRCAAIALAAEEGREMETDLTIALTDFSETERELFDACRTQQDSGTFLDDVRKEKM